MKPVTRRIASISCGMMFSATVFVLTTFTTSCSQGTLATRRVEMIDMSIAREEVEYIERLIKSRLLTPLPPTINLRHLIRLEAQNKRIETHRDEMYWLQWADEHFRTYMQQPMKGNSKYESSSNGFFR